MYKTIGVCGSRRRDTNKDYRLFYESFMNEFRKGDRMVSGGCKKGADSFAEILARSMGLTIIIHYADWNGADGKRAGFVRNTKIAGDCDVLIALVAEDRKGGTEDTVKKALKMGKRVVYT
jgi:hypothetical protein